MNQQNKEIEAEERFLKIENAIKVWDLQYNILVGIQRGEAIALRKEIAFYKSLYEEVGL